LGKQVVVAAVEGISKAVQQYLAAGGDGSALQKELSILNYV
jgi:hypothetical protein